MNPKADALTTFVGVVYPAFRPRLAEQSDDLNGGGYGRMTALRGRRNNMEDNQAENALSGQSDVTETKQTEDGWIIRRPKRMKLTAEESIRRTKEFVDTRGERFVASFRKSKS